MNTTEMIFRRRNVKAFIDADPISLVVTRQSSPVKNLETGGYINSVPSALPSQVARIVQNRRRYTPGIQNVEAGDIPHTDYLLVGGHSLDLQKDDTFTWAGDVYRIVGIHKARTESVLAAIELLGEPNRSE